ncbi:MAG TPA: toll/interleukin-1 receptor domain-containing protein [Pyrinomonadaceae bacterium]
MRDQIFISYSRQNERWLQMLQLHLSVLSATHKIKVWSDSQIQPGQQWNQEIDDALASTRVAVLLVSPEFLASKFIRTVELPALLEASKKGEIQLLWIAVSPSGYKYTEIGRFQAINDPKKPLATLTTKAKRESALVKIVEAIKEAYDRAELEPKTVRPVEYAPFIRGFFDEYLGLPSQPRAFGGRDVELGALNNWLDDIEASPYRLILAPAGRGKSALLAHWYQQLSARSVLTTIFIPVSMVFGTNLAQVVFTSIVSQLAGLWDESLPNIGSMDSTSIRALMGTYLDKKLPTGRGLLLILDGVDEAADWQVGPNLFPRYPQTGLRAIISARERAGDVDGMGWAQSFGWDRPGLADVMELGPLRRDGVDDVVSKTFASLIPSIAKPSVTDEIFRLSEGDPFLINFYLRDLVPEKAGGEPRLRPEELRNLQPGFKEWWIWQNLLWKTRKESPLDEPRVTAFLSLLSCALGPLSTEDILQLVPKEIGLNGWNLEEVVEPLSRMVLGNGKDHGFVFCHPKLANFFKTEQLAKQERNAYERRFLTWGSSSIHAMQNGELGADEISPYLVRYLGTHLEQAGASVAELSALVSDEWRCAWKRLEENHTGFLNDVSRVWGAAERANLAEINQSRKALFLHMEALCALCQSSIRSLSTIPDELTAALIEEELWSPMQALAFNNNRVRRCTRAQLVVRLPDAEREKVLDDAIRDIQTMEDEWFRALEFIQLAKTVPSSHFEMTVNLARESIGAVPGTIEKAWMLAYIANYYVGSSAEEIRKEAIELVLSRDEPAERVRGLCPLAEFLPSQEREKVLTRAEDLLGSIEDPEMRLRRCGDLFALLEDEAQTRVLMLALATAPLVEDPHQRLKSLVALLPCTLGPDQQSVARAELLTAELISDESRKAEYLIILASYLPESIRTPTINKALTILPREGAHIGGDEVNQALLRVIDSAYREADFASLPESIRTATIKKALSILPREGAHIGGGELNQALLRLIDFGYREEVFAVVNAIDAESLRTEVWFEVAAHLGEERPAEVNQALQAIKSIYLSQTRYLRFAAGVIRKLKWLIPEDEYKSFLWEALERERVIGDEQQIVDVLIAIAGYQPQTEREESLRAAACFARKIENPQALGETLLALSRVSPELALPDLYSRAFKTAQQNPDRENRFYTMMELLPHLPESERGDAIEIVLKEARAFTSKDTRVKALVRVIPFSQHPLRQELFEEILTLTRKLDDPSWRVQHLVKASFMVSKEDKPFFIKEARASALQVTYQESGLVAEMLLGNINRVAAFGFYAEALTIVRAINDAFERACMLIVILCYVPEIDREEAESETIATIRAIDDESTRIWLLTWLLRATKLPLKSEIADEIENYALANEWPLLRAAMLINIAAEMEDRRERLLATATGLVLNNHDEPKYDGILSCPYTYVFPIGLDRGLKLAPVFCGMLMGYYRRNNLFGPYPSRQYVIDTLMKLCPEVSDANQYSFANKLLHAGYQRPYLLDKIREYLPTFVTVGGLNCLNGISRSIQDVGAWWK